MKTPEAAERARALIQLFPALPICRFAAGLTLLRFGLVEEAAAALEEGLRMVPGDVFLLGVLALARSRQGRTADASEIRAALEERGRVRYLPFVARAYAAEACADMDSAYGLMGQAIEEREPLAVITLADRRNDLLPHPSFQCLLRKMNL